MSQVVAARGRAPRLPRVLARAGGWLRRSFLDPEAPLAAVEVRARSVGVVRVRRGAGFVAAAQVDLPPDTLQLSMTQSNVIDPARFRQALHGALERAGILGGARIALVLPDPVAKVSIVPASEAGVKGAPQTDELLRFKLKKSVPFEVREARLAWTSAGGRAADPFLVAAAFQPVIDGYEEVCRSLGLEPGLVELAGLALVRGAFTNLPPADRLLVNWDEGYVSLLLVRGDWPVMMRTLAVTSSAEVVREVTNTVLYYRERLGGEGLAGAALRSAAIPPEEAKEVLTAPLGFVPEVVAPWRALGAADLGPASQSLAGAASSLGAR